MDDIQKDKIHRFLQRLGIRVRLSSACKFPYDRENFLELKSQRDLVIFDIGANIGQSSIWYSINFPEAAIYAFEPFPVIFNRLKKNTLKYQSIKSYQFAFGEQQKQLEIPSVKDPLCQTAQIIERPMAKEQATDTIIVKTLDEFCLENLIDQIHILKTDTEGYDMNVLRGAQYLLSNKKIVNILTEASMNSEDKQHTNFFEINQFLSGYNYELFALYDLHHNSENGKLDYCNALFKRKN